MYLREKWSHGCRNGTSGALVVQSWLSWHKRRSIPFRLAGLFDAEWIWTLPRRSWPAVLFAGSNGSVALRFHLLAQSDEPEAKRRNNPDRTVPLMLDCGKAAGGIPMGCASALVSSWPPLGYFFLASLIRSYFSYQSGCYQIIGYRHTLSKWLADITTTLDAVCMESQRRQQRKRTISLTGSVFTVVTLRERVNFISLMKGKSWASRRFCPLLSSPASPALSLFNAIHLTSKPNILQSIPLLLLLRLLDVSDQSAEKRKTNEQTKQIID